jgi:hypothetical protein
LNFLSQKCAKIGAKTAKNYPERREKVTLSDPAADAVTEDANLKGESFSWSVADLSELCLASRS